MSISGNLGVASSVSTDPDWKEEDMEGLHEHARRLALFLDQYYWLSSTHVTDFFTENLWDGIPIEWRGVLESLSPDEATTFAGLAQDPAAMQAFLVSRAEQGKGPGVPPCMQSFLQDLSSMTLKRSPMDWGSVSAPGGGAWGDIKAGKGFGKGMNPKKMHEVSRLSCFISDSLSSLASQRSESDAGSDDAAHRPVVVLDIGSGQGYLSRVLAMRHSLDVVGVEADSCNVDAARKSDKSVSSQLQGMGWSGGGTLRHVPSRIEAGKGAEGLLRAVREGDDVLEGNHQRSFALVGLHSCGDLVPTMLRVFGETPQVTSVYAVSCCYMKLKTGSKPDDGEGRGGCGHSETPYPLSRFVSQLGTPLGSPESPIGFHMREQACHSIDSYSSKVLQEDSAPPMKGFPGFLHNHCYRAILELMVKGLGQAAPREKLDKSCSETTEGSLCRAVRSAAEEGGRRQRLAGVNREKVHKHESFSMYAKAVLRRASGGGGGKRGGLGEWVDERVSEIMETDLDAEYAAELTCWHRPAIFYALRLMMAPAIESMLLLDRLIFLREMPGVHAVLRPVFDPSISPRTFALAAWKESDGKSGKGAECA